MRSFDSQDGPGISSLYQTLLWNFVFFSVFMVFFFLPFAICMAEESGKLIVVTITKNVNVNSEKIRLGEISKIDAPADMLERISALELGPSPKAGKTKNIRLSSLKGMVEESVPSSHGVKLEAPPMIVVKRSSQIVSEEMLKEFFIKQVRQMSVGKDVDISGFRIRGKNEFSDGEVEIKTSDAQRGIRMGNISIPVEVFVNGSREGRLTLSGHASKRIRVLCAVRDLPKGLILSKEDIALVEKEEGSAGMRAGMISDVSQLIGRQLVSPVKMGEPFNDKRISVPAVLKKGDKVRLVARSGLLSIETTGEAVSDASLGDQVKIRNTDTGKLVNAKVVDAATVEAVF